ncbi:cytochrome P450 [Xylaria curta]|nr:cytochrome P450 [Xylaria curta]
MRAFEPTMLQEIDTFIKHLFDLSKSDAPVNMTPMCRHLSYDTAAHLGFGCSLNLQTDPTNRFIPKALSIGNLRINVCMNFPLLMKWRLHQRIADNVPNSLRDRFFEALNNMVTVRLSQPFHAKHDLCSFMAKSMGKEEQKPDRLDLVTEAVFFFPAGGETTAAALCALFFYLSRNSQCYKRLAAEIRSTFQSGIDIRGGPHLAGCKYLRACIDEALRISPPATGMLWRELAPVEKEEDKEPLVIDGHVIPHGTQVSVNLYSLHHNAEYFPDPFSFRPERWLEDSEDNEATRKAMSDAFAPFLVGSRSCAGKPMAYLEVSLTLAKTLWYFDFELPVGDSSHLGGGAPTGSGQRTRVNEFQLYDRFSAYHQGPNLVFHPRENFYS